MQEKKPTSQARMLSHSQGPSDHYEHGQHSSRKPRAADGICLSLHPFPFFLLFSLSFFFVSFKISEPGSSYTVWAGWPCNHTTLTSSVMGQVHTAHLLSTSFVSDRNLFQISERKTKVGRDIDYWWIIGNMTGLLATRFWIHPIWHPNCVYHRTG